MKLSNYPNLAALTYNDGINEVPLLNEESFKLLSRRITDDDLIDHLEKQASSKKNKAIAQSKVKSIFIWNYANDVDYRKENRPFIISILNSIDDNKEDVITDGILHGAMYYCPKDTEIEFLTLIMKKLKYKGLIKKNIEANISNAIFDDDPKTLELYLLRQVTLTSYQKDQLKRKAKEAIDENNIEKLKFFIKFGKSELNKQITVINGKSFNSLDYAIFKLASRSVDGEYPLVKELVLAGAVSKISIDRFRSDDILGPGFEAKFNEYKKEYLRSQPDPKAPTFPTRDTALFTAGSLAFGAAAGGLIALGAVGLVAWPVLAFFIALTVFMAVLMGAAAIALVVRHGVDDKEHKDSVKERGALVEAAVEKTTSQIANSGTSNDPTFTVSNAEAYSQVPPSQGKTPTKGKLIVSR